MKTDELWRIVTVMIVGGASIVALALVLWLGHAHQATVRTQTVPVYPTPSESGDWKVVPAPTGVSATPMPVASLDSGR